MLSMNCDLEGFAKRRVCMHYSFTTASTASQTLLFYFFSPTVFTTVFCLPDIIDPRVCFLRFLIVFTNVNNSLKPAKTKICIAFELCA